MTAPTSDFYTALFAFSLLWFCFDVVTPVPRKLMREARRRVWAGQSRHSLAYPPSWLFPVVWATLYAALTLSYASLLYDSSVDAASFDFAFLLFLLALIFLLVKTWTLVYVASVVPSDEPVFGSSCITTTLLVVHTCVLWLAAFSVLLMLAVLYKSLGAYEYHVVAWSAFVAWLTYAVYLVLAEAAGPRRRGRGKY